MSKVDKASGLKNKQLVLVNRPSVGKSNSVQWLESLISSKEQRRGWRIKMAKMGAASMSDAWTMRLSGIKLFRGVIACIVLQGLFWS